MKSFKSLLVRELQRELGYRKIEYNSKDRKAALQEVRTRFLTFNDNIYHTVWSMSYGHLILTLSRSRNSFLSMVPLSII